MLLILWFPDLLTQALSKLEASLGAGQSYEGHELFKTVFYRLRSRRKAADSYALAEVIFISKLSLEFLVDASVKEYY